MSEASPHPDPEGPDPDYRISLRRWMILAIVGTLALALFLFFGLKYLLGPSEVEQMANWLQKVTAWLLAITLVVITSTITVASIVLRRAEPKDNLAELQTSAVSMLETAIDEANGVDYLR